MSSPSTTASSIPTTPTTPFSLPSPLPAFDAMTSSMKTSHSVPFLALPPPVAVRPRRVALAPSFKLQPPPASFRSRSTIVEEQEDEDGSDRLELHVPVIKAMSDLSLNKLAEADQPRPAPLALSNPPKIVLPTILSPSATQPNRSFADAVAGRSPTAPTMSFGNLSGQPRSTKAGARTHRRAQSISVSVSLPAGFAPGSAPRRTPLPGSDSREPRLELPSRRPMSLTPSPRAVHFAPLPDAADKRASLPARAAHPRVSALAPAHPGLHPSYGLAKPSSLHPREASVPRALANSGRVIALPSFEDDAFTSMKGSSSYAFGMNSVAIAVGHGFEQWGE
ncbi:hypothetical protein RhiJN_15981 [Ceratobasidium sp. AG-Ba]|nr:hypothetical protein RhiJN_15981 [Ceratobasidium sp. AG-Ba]QRW02134.1 hypothetical protein RhiLY_01131 [Ceratobasidium sp. AG-Ba]